MFCNLKMERSFTPKHSNKGESNKEVITTKDISKFYKPLHKFDFEWTALKRSSTPMPSRQESFSYQSSTHVFKDAYEAFISIWDSKVMAYIAEQTNKYAKRITDHDITGWNLDWQDTNADELYVYFAILFTIEDSETVEKTWSKDGSEFKSDYFSCALSKKRFKCLSSCLYFGDIDTISNNCEITPTQQKWLVIKPVVTHLNERFSELFNLDRGIVINENAMASDFVRDSFTKDKIKIYQMSDYNHSLGYVSYVWRLEFEIDDILQEASALSEDSLSDNISSAVLKLVRGLKNKGHTIWLQDSFISPALARELKSLGFDCVGSFKTDKEFVPSECKTINLSNMTPGQLKRFTSNDIDLYTYSSMRNDGTKHYLSTFHNPFEVKSYLKTDIMEPSVVTDSNRSQDDIYEQDQLLDDTIYDKESTVWYHIIFMRLLNISARNAEALSEEISNTTFTLYGKLAYQLVENHGHVLSTPPMLHKESLE